MGINQCHENMHKTVKKKRVQWRADDKLKHWMLCSPEVARFVKEFEKVSMLRKRDPINFRHHEETPAFQKRFQTNYRNSISEFKKSSNPFLCKDDDIDFYQFDTKDLMIPDMIKTIYEIECLGQRQIKRFVSEWLQSIQISIDKPAKKNKLNLFSDAKKSSKFTSA